MVTDGNMLTSTWNFTIWMVIKGLIDDNIPYFQCQNQLAGFMKIASQTQSEVIFGVRLAHKLFDSCISDRSHPM